MIAASESALRPGVRAAGCTSLRGEVRRLALQSSHYLAGLLGGLALGLVSFPIFTRAFSAAEYGTIDLAQKVLTLLAIASKMGLQNAALRFYDGKQFASDVGSARAYYSTLFLGILSTSAGIALVSLAVVASARNLFLDGPLTGLMYLIVLLALLRAAGSMLWSFLRIEERTKMFNATAVGSKAAVIAAICALLPWSGRTARTFLLGMLVAEAAVLALLVAPLLRRGVVAITSFDPALFRSGIVFGMPLVIYEIAFALLGSADRFLVRHYLGADALGSYSVAYGIAQHVNELLLVPLFLALVPIYMRLWTSEGSEKTIGFLTFTLDLYLMAATGILAITAASAHDAVILLASSRYAAAGGLVPVLLAGLLIYAVHIFVAAGLLIHKRTLHMAGLLLLSAAFGIGSNWLLLPRLGLMGGALATLLSYSFCMLSLWRASNRVLPLRLNPQALARYVAAAVLAWLGASQVNFGPPSLNFPGRSALTLIIYCAGLCTLDTRVRGTIRWAVVRCRDRF